jgi:flagellar protein FliO/FliZ
MDGLALLRAVGALVFTLGLLIGGAMLLRRYGHKLSALGLAIPVAKTKRLSISEVMSVDARHRLLLIRRDDTEHLVLMGPTGATVIEQKITPLPAEISPETKSPETKA